MSKTFGKLKEISKEISKEIKKEIIRTAGPQGQAKRDRNNRSSNIPAQQLNPGPDPFADQQVTPANSNTSALYESSVDSTADGQGDSPSASDYASPSRAPDGQTIPEIDPDPRNPSVGINEMPSNSNKADKNYLPYRGGQSDGRGHKDGTRPTSSRPATRDGTAAPDERTRFDTEDLRKVKDRIWLNAQEIARDIVDQKTLESRFRKYGADGGLHLLLKAYEPSLEAERTMKRITTTIHSSTREIISSEELNTAFEKNGGLQGVVDTVLTHLREAIASGHEVRDHIRVILSPVVSREELTAAYSLPGMQALSNLLSDVVGRLHATEYDYNNLDHRLRKDAREWVQESAIEREEQTSGVLNITLICVRKRIKDLKLRVADLEGQVEQGSSRYRLLAGEKDALQGKVARLESREQEHQIAMGNTIAQHNVTIDELEKKWKRNLKAQQTEAAKALQATEARHKTDMETRQASYKKKLEAKDAAIQSAEIKLKGETSDWQQRLKAEQAEATKRLQAAESRHKSELDARHAAHKKKLDDRDANLQSAEAKHKAAVGEWQRRLTAEQNDGAGRLQSAEARYTRELETRQAAHKKKLDDRDAAFESAQAKHGAELVEAQKRLRAEKSDALKRLQSAESRRKQDLEALEASHRKELEERDEILAVAEKRHKEELLHEQQRLDLTEAEFKKDIRSREVRHNNKLATAEATYQSTLQELSKAMQSAKATHDSEMLALRQAHSDEIAALTKQFETKLEEQHMAIMKENEELKGALQVRQHVKGLSDHEIRTAFKKLVREIDSFSRFPWEKRKQQQWPIAEQVIARAQNSRKLKQMIVQTTIWLILAEKVFGTPFVVFMDEGHSSYRAWIRDFGQGECCFLRDQI